MENLKRVLRADYPVCAVWNTVLTGVVFEYDSIESLWRKLSRNAQQHWLCGFEGNIVLPSYIIHSL